jgi:SAM-dependent methyltransferase
MQPFALDALLQCPQCRSGNLGRDRDGHFCQRCAARFPDVGGLAWLFAEPALLLGEWRNRLTLYLEELGAAERMARSDLSHASLGATRARIGALAEAYRLQGRAVAGILEPLALERLPLPQATGAAFEMRLPLAQDLHSYYPNLHRDWCWGEGENASFHGVVSELLGPGRTRVLVLGAGGCRLAYDLHRHGAQAATVALDINPLLLLVAERVVRGGSVEIYEFPIAPQTGRDVALLRSLRAPEPSRPGLELVFGDAFRAPFAPRSFDAVVTPWLIDIVEEGPLQLASEVNRLLAPGGRWVNVGSLAFPWRRPALRPGPDELLEEVREAGFDIAARRDDEIPYLRSPASRHGRLERVFGFAADKLRRGPRMSGADDRAEWIRDSSRPVPATAQVQLAAEAARIRAILLALVDGRRSIDDLTRIVAEQGLLPPLQAASAVRQLLEQLHEQERRA